jgi:hypothetical protein
MLDHWHEFYALLGTAAAALLALLFVAASLGAGILSRERSGPTRTYMSPVAFHYTAVLFVSALALVPSLMPPVFGTVLTCAAAAGLVYSAFVLGRLLRDGIADVADQLAYGLAPLLSYAALLAAATLFFAASDVAAYVLAAGAMVLLIINVRNAWICCSPWRASAASRECRVNPR